MKKKKGFDPFEAVVKHGKLTAGTIGVMGVTGRMADVMPSPQSAKIVSGMDTLKVLPTVHAAGITMGSLGMLSDVEKKAKRRR